MSKPLLSFSAAETMAGINFFCCDSMLYLYLKATTLKNSRRSHNMKHEHKDKQLSNKMLLICMNTKRKIMIFDVVLCNNLEEDNAVKHPREDFFVGYIETLF